MVTGRKLLLADDSATIQKVVDLTFSDEGLEVITVSDGQQAVEKLEEVFPDIVLADVFMPGLSGYEVCEYIKRSERFRHIPVMLLVGSFEPFDEAEARRVGADDYLTKPFQSIRTLIGKVGNLLSGGGAAEDATTRRLIPPPEAEKENRPETDFLERSTADTAPLPQHEREETERKRSSSEVSYTDLSMDDEMIEAMPGNDYASGAAMPREAHARPTKQYTTADLEEAGIATASEDAGAPEQETIAAFASGRVNEPSVVAAASQSRASGMAASEDALLDLGDLEAPSSMVEADDFILDLRDDEGLEQTWPSAPVFAEGFDRREETAVPDSEAGEMNASARVADEEETAEAQPQAQEFVDEQVLSDEQSSGFALVEEESSQFTEYQSEPPPPAMTEQTAYDMQTAPTERLPQDYQFEETPAAPSPDESSAASSAPVATGQITLEQLSPEVIDAIARRAVEQLSERVVEQIAWEVVPDLALLIIKRRLEEEKP